MTLSTTNARQHLFRACLRLDAFDNAANHPNVGAYEISQRLEEIVSDIQAGLDAVRPDIVGLVHIPEIRNRVGTVVLHFGSDPDRESVEITGTITLSEICFLHRILAKYINDRLEEP